MNDITSKQQKRRIFLISLIFLCLISGSILLTSADDSQLNAEKIYSQYSNQVYYLKVYRADGSLKTVGSAFIIKNQKALTAAHVVKDAAKVELINTETSKAQAVKIIASDEKADLALLETTLSPSEGLEISEVAPKHGQALYVIGYPLKDTKVITEGIVASPKALMNGQAKLLMTATVAPGMSGGPVFNHNGQVIGLVSGSTKVMNELHLSVDYTALKTMTGGK